MSCGACESDMRNFKRYEKLTAELDKSNTSTVTIDPSHSFRANSRQIRAELPASLISYRDDETERDIDE